MLTERIRSASEAARIIQQGGLVAFPTETVFGLGVDATNTAAVERLFAAKGRPSDNPLIVHLSEPSAWPLAASELTPHAKALMDAYTPGPLTVVLPKLSSISPLVSAGLETIGLRVPSHPIAQSILQAAGVPVAAPSANRSGRPSTTTWRSVLEDLDGRVDAVFCHDSDSIGIESTVVDCCGDVPVILRPGAITLEQVQRIIPGAKELRAKELRAGTLPITALPDDQVGLDDRVRSPGLLHPHYQPRAKVQLINSPHREMIQSDQSVAYCGLDGFEGADQLALSVVFTTVEEYAAGFYEFLRDVDRHSISLVFVQAAPRDGLGQALLDRQRRASGC